MKKDFQRQAHTWMRKKVKKPWYIRKRKKEGGGPEKNKEKEKSDL